MAVEVSLKQVLLWALSPSDYFLSIKNIVTRMLQVREGCEVCPSETMFYSAYCNDSSGSTCEVCTVDQLPSFKGFTCERP